MTPQPTSWHNKRVFLTGHTGFKGGWLALWLSHLGANVRGYALEPNTSAKLLTATGLHNKVDDISGDIRYPASLDRAIQDFAPEIIFHLAAQPLVRLSYEDPIATYETNVIGTARILDAVRRTPSVKAVVVVTTDKCYENHETLRPYKETDPLGGYDPYSSSQACAEIAAASFRQSYFHPDNLAHHGVAIASARAGNVIGGGGLVHRPPHPRPRPRPPPEPPSSSATLAPSRPWQHVLPSPSAATSPSPKKLLTPDRNHSAPYATAYNFAPEIDAQPVAWIADRMANFWGNGASWVLDKSPTPHEAHYLKLDATRAHTDLYWTPHLHLETALQWLVQWYRAHQAGTDMQSYTLDQIATYRSLFK